MLRLQSPFGTQLREPLTLTLKRDINLGRHASNDPLMPKDQKSGNPEITSFSRTHFTSGIVMHRSVAGSQSSFVRVTDSVANDTFKMLCIHGNNIEMIGIAPLPKPFNVPPCYSITTIVMQLPSVCCTGNRRTVLCIENSRSGIRFQVRFSKEENFSRVQFSLWLASLIGGSSPMRWFPDRAIEALSFKSSVLINLLIDYKSKRSGFTIHKIHSN